MFTDGYIAPASLSTWRFQSRGEHFRFRCVFRAVYAASAVQRRPFAWVELKTTTEALRLTLGLVRSARWSPLHSPLPCYRRTASIPCQWQWPRPDPTRPKTHCCCCRPPRNAKFHFLLRLAVVGKCKSLGFSSASLLLRSPLLWPGPVRPTVCLHSIQIGPDLGNWRGCQLKRKLLA